MYNDVWVDWRFCRTFYEGFMNETFNAGRSNPGTIHGPYSHFHRPVVSVIKSVIYDPTAVVGHSIYIWPQYIYGHRGTV